MVNRYVAIKLHPRKIGSNLPQATHRPQVVNRKSLSHILKQHLSSDSDPNVTEQIRNILTPPGSHPVHSEKAENPNDDRVKLVQDFLSSIFPGLVFEAQPEAGDNETDPASRAEGHREFTQKPGSTNATTAPGPLPLDPSPTRESAPPVKPTVVETEQVPDRTTSLSSIEHIRNNLTKLRADFAFPTELDQYPPSADDHDETASVSSLSSSDLTKLIPYTSANKPVYKYEQALNGLLEGLDRIESHGDAEVRDKRKEVVKAIEKALEGVEHAVGEAVKERLSLIPTTSLVTEEPPKGFDVDYDVTEAVVLGSAEEQVGAPVVADMLELPRNSPQPTQKRPSPSPWENILQPKEGAGVQHSSSSRQRGHNPARRIFIKPK